MIQNEEKNYMELTPEELIEELVVKDKEIRRLRAVQNGQVQQIQLLEQSLSLRIGRKFEWVFAIKRSIRQFWRKQKQTQKHRARARELAQIRSSRDAERQATQVSRQNEKRKKNALNSIRNKTVSFKKEPVIPALEKRVYDFSDKNLKDLKVATILDEFSYNCFKYEMDLYPVHIENTLEELEVLKPDLLFVESAWKGSFGQWKVGHATNYNRMVKLTNYCKENGIATLFWCKEDPVHFEHFIPVAKLFDYVFTTDENMVPEYQERCGHVDVYVLPFAAQPQIHNPVKTYDRENKVCFAGSYYRNKYPERSATLCDMLKAAQTVGVDIYDRNFESGIDHYRFPEEFEGNVCGVLPYEEIEKAYKGYKVNVNVNTVTQSPTMFSRRVFESLACNTPMISNYSEGVEDFFGNLIEMSENIETYMTHLTTLFEDDLVYQQIALSGLRRVLKGNTYQDRTRHLLSPLKIATESTNPVVLAMGFATSQTVYQHLIDVFNHQSYEALSLIIFTTNTDLLTLEAPKGVRVVEWSDSNELNWSEVTAQPFDYLTVFHAAHYYGSEYVGDLIRTTLYGDYDAISKSENLMAMENEVRYVEHATEYQYGGNAMNVCRGLLNVKLLNESVFESYFHDEWVEIDSQVFYIDSFNFLSEVSVMLTEELESQINI